MLNTFVHVQWCTKCEMRTSCNTCKTTTLSFHAANTIEPLCVVHRHSTRNFMMGQEKLKWRYHSMRANCRSIRNGLAKHSTKTFSHFSMSKKLHSGIWQQRWWSWITKRCLKPDEVIKRLIFFPVTPSQGDGWHLLAFWTIFNFWSMMRTKWKTFARSTEKRPH